MEETTEFLRIPEEIEIEGISFHKFQGNEEISEIKELNDSILSESYSSFTYHFFLRSVTSITWTVGLFIRSDDLGEKSGRKNGGRVCLYARHVCKTTSRIYWNAVCHS